MSDRRLFAPLTFLGIVTLLALPTASRGWDYEGHRLVNQLALDSLPKDFPAFVRVAQARERILFLGGEADRWRNSPDLSFKHASSPDHYFDFEDLELLRAEAQSLSPFRYEFVARLYHERAARPQGFPLIDPLKNADHTRELVGFLPWAIVEQQAKLKSAFSCLAAFEQIGGTRDEIANAQQNIIYLMGVMGHFVADGAQPLHTTRHHHGWVGANPHGYTTNAGLHSWLDGGYLRKAGLRADGLRTRLRPARAVVSVDASGLHTNLFPVIVTWLLEQHRQVEPLYRLEQERKLAVGGEPTPEGTAFLSGQLMAAGQMLGDLWVTAWQQAPPDKFLIDALTKRRNGDGPARQWPAP